jgi:uncharacterized membrane protein
MVGRGVRRPFRRMAALCDRFGRQSLQRLAITSDVVRDRVAQPKPPASSVARRLTAVADRFILWLSQRWLAVLNALALAYVGLPVVAPMLMYVGLDWPARVIHSLYRPLCHQLPQRSFFLFGPKLTYSLQELAELAGAVVVEAPWSGSFVGNATVGYKVALCQRDTAIYLAILLSGLVYGLIRRRVKVRPLPWWAYAGLGVLPMLVDGGYQWVSYALATLVPSLEIIPHETTPTLRVITGALFGLSTVWLAYPHVGDTMDEVRESLESKKSRARQLCETEDAEAVKAG